MVFWAAEVESGASYDVKLRGGEIFHLSQVCLGEFKERKESASLYMTVDGRKLLFGKLNRERCPTLIFDLVFKNNDLKISHNRKSGSVYFYGYKTGYDSDLDDSSSEDEEEELPLPGVTGKEDAKKEEKAVVAARQDVNASSSTEDSDDDEEDNEDSSDDEEQEETPKKSGKKRVNEYARKTSTNKKAKVATKTDGKKGEALHIAAHRPSKQRKAPAGGNKLNQKTSGF